jgi:Amidohydrolase family/Carbohydrate binding domain (family 11)
MVCVKSSRVLSSWPGLVSSAVLIAALTAVAHVNAQSPQPSSSSSSSSSTSAAAPAATAIVNARIIDGSGNAPFEGTVVIKGDRIAEVGRSVKPPEGARLIDAAGGAVMPGLVDLVVELPRGAANDALTRAAAAYLYSGVTTVVPAGLSAADVDAIRDRLLRAGIKSPRLAMPAAPDRLVRGGASGGSLADAQAFTEWKQNNATYVPVLAAAAPAESRKPTPLLNEVSGGGGAAAAANEASSASSASNGGATSGGALNGGAGATGNAASASGAAAQADPARWKALLDQTRSARDAGIRLGLGSGGGAHGLPHGWSSLLAVRLFADAGITPLQAVTAATSGGAWALGVQSDRGFLAVGQRADLVVVSGDPSSSINDIEKIAHVILGGEVLDRAALRASIAGASAPAGAESTANATGGRPSSAATAGAPNAANNTSTGAAANANAAAGTPGASGAVDPKARGGKLTARERAAARKRGAAGTATSPESTAATTESPATPGSPASGSAGASNSASSATGSPGVPSTAPSSGTPSSAASTSAAPSTAAPGAAANTSSGVAPSSASPPSTAPGASASSSEAGAPNGSAVGASPGAVSTMAGAIVATSPVIDDFESGRDASTISGAWTSAGESPTSSTTVVMGRVVRGARDHALNVTARMGEARDAHARVTVRVAQDGRPLDVSRFHGVRFDARGQGRYRIIFVSRSVTDGRYHESNFSGSPLWTPVSIPFASVGQTGKGERKQWTGRDLVEIVFLLARDPGEFGYLELDNIRFY